MVLSDVFCVFEELRHPGLIRWVLPRPQISYPSGDPMKAFAMCGEGRENGKSVRLTIVGVNGVKAKPRVLEKRS